MQASTEGHSRPAVDRMYRIHQLLQSKEYPNSTALAREFEVSTRTIKRDIEFMKLRMDLPVEFDAVKNGYYYTRPVDQFPQMPMSEAELFALLVAHKAIAQYKGTPFEQPLSSAFHRLTGQLDRTIQFSLGHLDEVLSFRPLAPGDADLKTFEALTTGLRKHLNVTFLYRNRGQLQPATRNAAPLHLACIQNQWYLIAFDNRRHGIRTFALSRMRGACVGQEHFTPPPGFDPNEYLKGSFGVFKGGDDYEVVLQFDAWAADEVRGRRWHSSQELMELPNGMLRLRMRLNSLEEVERWVLSLGSHVQVVRPRKLAERLKDAGQWLARHYRDGGHAAEEA